MTNENKISSKMEQKSKNGKSSTSTLLYCPASKKLKIKFFAARRKNLVLQTFSDHDRFWSGFENFTNRPISLNSVTIESIRSHSYLRYCWRNHYKTQDEDQAPHSDELKSIWTMTTLFCVLQFDVSFLAPPSELHAASAGFGFMQNWKKYCGKSRRQSDMSPRRHVTHQLFFDFPN